MRNYKPEVQIKKITANPSFIVKVANLTEEAACLAVELDYDMFGHLPINMQENEAVRLKVCSTFGLGILQFSQTATDEMWHQAAVNNPTVIRFIDKPNEDTVWTVLSSNPALIDHVNNATEEMKAAAAIMA